MKIQSLRTDDCIDEVIEKYSNMVYRLALSHMKTKHDAEDVFLKYISKPRNFESEAHRKAWFIRVTINRCNSLWALLSSHKSEPLDDTMSYEETEHHDLDVYLSKLPKRHRDVIYLFYYEDLSVKQISKIMKAKESTVRTWLTRARCAMKEELKGDFADGYGYL